MSSEQISAATPEDLKQYIVAIRGRLQQLEDEMEETKEENRELRQDKQEIREELDDAQEEIRELKATTDMLRVVEQADEAGPKQRSLALIQHLKRKAEKERQRGRSAKASVNRDEAEEALHYPDVDRTTIYRDMERAQRLVGNKDVLHYDGASGGGSRLKLNLEADDLPASVTGTGEL